MAEIRAAEGEERLKKIAEEMRGFDSNDGSKTYRYKPNEDARLDSEQLSQLITPEESVLLDAALEAHQRLKSLHYIKRMTDGSHLAQCFDKLGGDISTRLHRKAIAISITEELSLTPWALTENFYNAREKREGAGTEWHLAMSGIGDPTGIGAGHSYTRMRIKEVNHEERRRRGQGAPPPRPGTKAFREAAKLRAANEGGNAQQNEADQFDLTHTKKEKMIEWLSTNGGESYDKVCNMSRADLMALVRSKRSSVAGDEGNQGEGGYVPTSEELDVLGSEIWRKQLELLSTEASGPSSSNAGGGGGDGDVEMEEDDDDDDDMMAEMLAASMDKERPGAGPNKYDDRRELEELRQERAEREFNKSLGAAAGGYAAAAAGGYAAAALPQAVAADMHGGRGEPPPGPDGKPRRWVKKTRIVDVLRTTRWDIDPRSGVATKRVTETKDRAKIRKYKESEKRKAEAEEAALDDDLRRKKAEEKAEAEDGGEAKAKG